MTTTPLTCTIDDVTYALRSGTVEDVQNRNETKIWGGGGGGRVHGGTGHMNDVVIKSSTVHWKDVRLRWNDGSRETIVLPGDLNAVRDDEVKVLTAASVNLDFGPIGYRNDTEAKFWWWEIVDEKIMPDARMRSRFLPGYDTLVMIGKTFGFLAVLPGLFVVPIGLMSGYYTLVSAFVAIIIVTMLMDISSKKKVTQLKTKMNSEAKRLITDFHAEDRQMTPVRTSRPALP